MMQLNDNIQINAGKALDNKYLKNGITPYISTSDANTTVPAAYRNKGLRVLIDTGSGPHEYWWLNGTTNGDLVAVASSSSVASVFGRTGTVTAQNGDYTSDQVTQGVTNKYFSNTLARGAISVTGSLAYDSATGIFSYTTPSALPPNGSATGDLTGTYPAPTVVWVNGETTYDARYCMLTTNQTVAGNKTFTGTTALGITTIASGVSGTAGLRFLNITSASTSAGTLAKALGLDGSGNVILGDVPGVTGSGAVDSVYGRIGTVIAVSGDYTAAQVTNAVDQTGSYANPTWITSLAWSKITGTPTTRAGYGITDAQPLDADLTTIAGLTPVANDVLQFKSGAWINRTPAQLKVDLALTKTDVGLGNVPNVDATIATNITSGTLSAARLPALTGDVTSIAGTAATTISNGVVSYAKMQAVSAGRILGRYNALNGTVQEIAVGTGLFLDSSTGTLSATGGGGTGGTAPDLQVIWVNNLGTAGTVAASSTRFTAVTGSALGITEVDKMIIAPASGVLKQMFVLVAGSQSSTGSLTITVRKGSSVGTIADTTLKVTVAASTNAAGGTVLSDTTHSISVNAGDIISYKLINAATATSLSVYSISLVFANS